MERHYAFVALTDDSFLMGVAHVTAAYVAFSAAAAAAVSGDDDIMQTAEEAMHQLHCRRENTWAEVRQ